MEPKLKKRRQANKAIQTVRISNDERTEKLKKTLEIAMDICERGSLETCDGGPGKVYCDYMNTPKFVRECQPRSKKSSLPMKKDIVSVLRECLISHRFTDAARMLDILSYDAGITRMLSCYLFPGGFEVLENHPNSNADLVEYFARNNFANPHLNKREIILELVVYKLKNEKLENLRSVQQLVQNHRTFKQNPVIDQLFKAYCVMIDYISWAQLKDCSDQNTEMKKFKERIISVLSELVQLEGQWDIFVPKLIEVLEFYNEIDEGEDILEKHLQANETNLNAYIFLYEYLKRHERNGSRQLECLKSIVRMSPSDPLALELISLLLQGSKTEKALRLLMKFVDYADNKNNLNCWKMLADICMSVVECPSSTSLSILQYGWRKSGSYWPLYHFDPNTILVRDKTDAKLLICKSTFLLVSQGLNEHPYVQAAESHLQNYPRYQNKMRKMVTKVKSLTSAHEK